MQAASPASILLKHLVQVARVCHVRGTIFALAGTSTKLPAPQQQAAVGIVTGLRASARMGTVVARESAYPVIGSSVLMSFTQLGAEASQVELATVVLRAPLVSTAMDAQGIAQVLVLTVQLVHMQRERHSEQAVVLATLFALLSNTSQVAGEDLKVSAINASHVLKASTGLNARGTSREAARIAKCARLDSSQKNVCLITKELATLVPLENMQIRKV
jgi:hypothetical protein